MELFAVMQIPTETNLVDFVLITSRLLAEQLGVGAIGRVEYERRVATAFEYGLVKLDAVPGLPHLRTQLLDAYLAAGSSHFSYFEVGAPGISLSEKGLQRVAELWDADNLAIRNPIKVNNNKLIICLYFGCNSVTDGPPIPL